MSTLLKINVTEARKKIYSLIDRVSRGELRVLIRNTDIRKSVMLVPVDMELLEKENEKNLRIAASTKGLLSGGEYDPDEFDKAKKQL